MKINWHMDLKSKTLKELSAMICSDWKKVNFGAVPYLNAMVSMPDDGMYGQDSWDSVVIYFLSNATTWRGDTAREIKKELKRRYDFDQMNGEAV